MSDANRHRLTLPHQAPWRRGRGGRLAKLRPMTKPPLSEAIQDYLKGIYKLQDAGGRVTITAVARDQGVSAASASAMVKKLAALGLLEHEPYRGARLTDAGERVAVEVIRHHRLLELYLAETLGLDVDARARRGRPARARDLGGARGAHRPRARLSDARPARGPDPRREPPLARYCVGWPKKSRSSGRSSSSRRNGLIRPPNPSSSETTQSSSSVAFADVERVVELVALPEPVSRGERRRAGGSRSGRPSRARPAGARSRSRPARRHPHRHAPRRRARQTARPASRPSRRPSIRK